MPKKQQEIEILETIQVGGVAYILSYHSKHGLKIKTPRRGYVRISRADSPSFAAAIKGFVHRSEARLVQQGH